MKILAINEGKDELMVVPKPPVYLSKNAKKHFTEIGNILCTAGKMRIEFLSTLEVLAESKAEFEWACREIEIKNKEKSGSGFIQKFSSGATNITTEMAIKKNAMSDILKCAKVFGLEPKSNKELGETKTNQLDLFEELLKIKNA